MKKTTERARLLFTALSPVHIGCGADYEPTEYVDDGDNITVFGVDQLIAALPSDGKLKLLEATKHPTDPLGAVKRVIHSYKAQLKQAAGARQIQKLAINLPLNHNGRAIIIKRIERTAFDPLTDGAILPGSSIKGALRTAWINQHRNLLQTSIERDPLRLLSVADAFADNEARGIMFLQRPHKGPLPNIEPGTPSSVRYDYLLEAICRRGKFRTEIGLTQQEGALVDCPLTSLKALANAANVHYRQELEQTVIYLQGMKNHDYATQWLEFIDKNILQLRGKAKDKVTGEIREVRTFGGMIADGEGFLLRLGKHGGAESLTLDGMRQIKTKYGTKHAAHTMTLTLNSIDELEKCEPFGWIFVQMQPLKPV